MAAKQNATFEDRFISELKRQCNGQDIAISNKSLREALGWQDANFDKTRAALIEKGTIKAGPGQGGTTRFSTPPAPDKPAKKPLKAFISYSHSDEELKNALMAHLHPLKQLDLVGTWSDRSMKPGDHIDNEIKKQLSTADLILLLVSVDFIKSKYCYEIELEAALKREKAGKAKIVPIILRACLWQHAPFGGMLALPKDGKAVTSFADRDEAFADIAKELRDLAQELLAD